MLLPMKKMKLSILDTPPLQNHYSGIAVDAKMEPPWRLEPIFMLNENDDRNAMPFRELSETFLRLKATAEERWVVLGPGGGPRLYI